MYRMLFCDYHPELLSNILLENRTVTSSTRNLNDPNYIRPIFLRVNTVRNSFLYQFVKIWNQIPKFNPTPEKIFLKEIIFNIQGHYTEYINEII